MSSKRKHNSIKELKERYGLMFISPWIIGMILFFIFPIFPLVRRISPKSSRYLGAQGIYLNRFLERVILVSFFAARSFAERFFPKRTFIQV